MRYVYLLCFVYLSFLMIFSSCEKEDLGPAHNDACLDDNNAFEDMKAWYYFKQGTYWIYEEQNSGQRDTLIVYEDAVAQFDTIYEFAWHAQSSLNYKHHQWVNTSWSGPCAQYSFCTCNWVFKSRVNEQGFVGQDRTYIFPHSKGFSVYNLWIGNTTIADLQDSLIINDFMFHDIVTYETEYDESWDGHAVIYQFAKNVGMISRVVPALNEDWRLVEYAVVK